MPGEDRDGACHEDGGGGVDGRAFRYGRGEHDLCAPLEGEVDRGEARDGGHGGEDRAGGQPLGREVGEAEGEDRAEDDEGGLRLERHPEGPAHGEDRGERHRDGGEAVGEGGVGIGPAWPGRGPRTVPEVRKAWAFQSEWATMWSVAAVKAPKPHWRSMKPICATVDQASDTLTELCAIMASEPAAAAIPPRRARACMA